MAIEAEVFAAASMFVTTESSASIEEGAIAVSHQVGHSRQ
jgi:hypothetical protein